MSSISPATLLASPSSLSSPTQTDIQDTQSSHSESHQPQYQQQQQTQASKTTEYKSNFRPFDQYVYNELTDSFVKHKSPTASNNNNLLIESTGGSNQDLNAYGSISPALEVSSFEPNNGGPDQHYDVTKEPWYKEVVKRNEKANEYRFKSEVGHSSPLLKQADGNNTIGLSNDELSAVSLVDEQQHAAPTSPAPTNPDEHSSRRSYNFTPHDYKRDHLIATMANNNNFKLPKEDQPQQERSAAARRIQGTSNAARPATSSARPLIRTTASSRARSQSSRKLVGSSTGSTKAEPASKSNQSSPVKSATSRQQTTRTSLAPARPSAAKASNGTATSAPRPSARPSTLSSSGGLTRPSTTVARRTVAVSGTAPTSRPAISTSKSGASGATTTANRLSTARAPTLNTASRSTSTRTPASSTTGTITITANKARASPVKKSTSHAPVAKTTTRPNTAAPARNSLSRAPTSRSGSTSGAAASSIASNEPKSIKSKALAHAGEKAAALAAASLATGAGVAALSSPDTAAELASTPADTHQQSPTSPVDADSHYAATQANANYYLDQEPNLIITTTEKGNMLADEIARAEKEAQEEASRVRRELADHQTDSSRLAPEIVGATELESTVATHQSQGEAEVGGEQSAAKPDRDNVSEELVNGLSGGIVSAEDTYEHSERDSSLEFGSQQVTRPEAHQQDQNDPDDDQEPYSLMPTTFDTARQEEPAATQQYIEEASSEEDNLADCHSSKNEVSKDTTNSGGVQYEELSEPKRGDESRRVEFDLNVRTKSADSLHEAEMIESRSSANLESGNPEEVESEQAAPSNDDSRGTVQAEQPANDLSDEPYEHLEPEPEPEAALEEPQWKDDSIGKQDQNEHGDGIEDGFEIIEKELSGDEAYGDRERNLESDAVVAEPENLVADEAEDVAQVRDQKSDESGEKKESDSVQLEEEKKVDEVTQEKPEFQMAEEPLITKTVDGHKLTEELELAGGLADQEHDAKFERSVDAPSVFVPHSDDLSDIIMERRQSIEIDDQQASTSSSNSGSDVCPSQTESTLVNQIDDDKQVDLVNKTSANQGHEEEVQIQETGSSSNELLMNVADLLESETRAKEVMARKSELARQQSNSRGSLTFAQAGEILLSADQLNEQFAQSSGDNSTVNAAKPNLEVEPKQHDEDSVQADAILSAGHEVSPEFDATAQEHQRQRQADLNTSQTRSTALTFDTECDQEILSVQKLASLEQKETGDLVNFGSITPTQEQPQHDQYRPAADQQRDLMSEDSDEKQQQQQQELVNKESNRILEIRSSSDLMGSGNSDEKQVHTTEHLNESNNLLYDELMDDDEHQKLSNHLTNSDDDVILAPRNTKETLVDDCFSPQKPALGSRYNEGAGLSSMVQQEEEAFDGCESAAELADGSSAAVETPTVAENRVELATSKSPMPELHAIGSTGFVSKLSIQRNGFDSDDDDGQDLGLNPNVDPIDVAATLSPSSSVAEEMLRLSRQASDASMTGGAAPKLAAEFRSDKLVGESFEKDADTYISGGTSVANVATQPTAETDLVTDQIRRASNEPKPNADANILNNNNNEAQRRGANEETEEPTAGLAQRKASPDLSATNGDGKEGEAAAGQPEDSSPAADSGQR